MLIFIGVGGLQISDRIKTSGVFWPLLQASDVDKNREALIFPLIPLIVDNLVSIMNSALRLGVSPLSLCECYLLMQMHQLISLAVLHLTCVFYLCVSMDDWNEYEYEMKIIKCIILYYYERGKTG